MSFFVKICIKIMFEFDGEIFVHLYPDKYELILK